MVIRKHSQIRFWLLCLCLAGAGSLYSCNSDSGNGSAEPDDGFDRRALLANVGENIILKRYRSFAEAAKGLEAATMAYAADPSEANLTQARDAWKQAMSAWQGAELTQLGPTGQMGSVAGGQDLRDHIYSWPTVNPCAVDQELVRGDYADAAAFRAKLPNVRGLDALEYLLFNESTENACTPQATINNAGEWQAITDELSTRRAQYSQTLAANLRFRADELVGAWSAEGSGFVSELASAGEDSKLFDSSQEALNALTDAMFYLDTELKDMKVAEPAGLTDACLEATCPGQLESQFAHVSKQNIEENVLMFQRLYLGSDPGASGQGFDDMLTFFGADALNARMSTNLEAAVQAVTAIEEASLREALNKDPESVRALHAAVKAITDDLKSEFISVLDLDLPARAEGDND